MPSFSSQKPKSKEKSERDRLEPHQKTQKKRNKETEDRGRPQKSQDGITPGAKRVPTTSPSRPRKDPRKPRPPRTPSPPPTPPAPPPQPSPPPDPPTTTSSATPYSEVSLVGIKSNDTGSSSGIVSVAIPTTFEMQIFGKAVTATVTATVNTKQEESFISKELVDTLRIKSKGARNIRTFYDSSGTQYTVKDRIKATFQIFGLTVEDHCLYIVPGKCSNHVVLGTEAWDKVRRDMPDASQQEKTQYSSYYSQQSSSLPMRGAATPLNPESNVPSNYSQGGTQ